VGEESRRSRIMGMERFSREECKVNEIEVAMDGVWLLEEQGREK
jgi:hypothetical protein